MEKFTATGFLLRWLLALVLVFATYNPGGWSYVHWLTDTLPAVTPALVVCGLVLLAGWLVFIGATQRSMGSTGILLSAALFAALVWLLIAQGWLELRDTRALVWLALVMLSALLAIGMSWSHINRRLSGQADVDEVDSR